MSCPFSHDDAAYVLGILAPAERLAFQQHLAGCPGCTTAVAELAGMPGLLARVSPAVLQDPPDEPVPDLGPGLLRAVRRSRRRRTLLAAGLAAAAAVLVLGVPLGIALGGGDPAPSGPGVTAVPVSLPMDPVGDVPVEATVSLEQVTWGTRLGLSCTYDRHWVEADLPREADYVLVVRTRSGGLERVGSWRSVSGRRMEITAATATTRADVESVEVRTTDGRVVLRLST